ncbi:PKS-NRPS hybrid synthetase CHGG_01239 [Colletotrichum liriopes]|uniref:PKS-NRPS hybrid synthetase CHGG_01239 n=1 Tax=Colletotrichum liriopes TaxID=708192 RepID=A0AA37H0P9_9PEZI|nr:PKS-NRPS hybrid synthetase CHGG_01239 [Colletotrichum liriopes]
MDATYNVNRFNPPLFEINGISAINSTFPIAYGLGPHEDEEYFTWCFRQLEELRQEVKISLPHVIISDFDKALKNAALAVYPNVQQRICLWHIINNVVKHAKAKWKGPIAAVGDEESLAQQLMDETAQGAAKLPTAGKSNYGHFIHDQTGLLAA